MHYLKKILSVVSFNLFNFLFHHQSSGIRNFVRRASFRLPVLDGITRFRMKGIQKLKIEECLFVRYNKSVRLLVC